MFFLWCGVEEVVEHALSQTKKEKGCSVYHRGTECVCIGRDMHTMYYSSNTRASGAEQKSHCMSDKTVSLVEDVEERRQRLVNVCSSIT